MRKHITVLIFFSVFFAHVSAQTTSLQEKAESLANDPVFQNAITGISVISGHGEILSSVNAEKMLVPASNMKLISTGAALYELGPDYKFHTGIWYDGNIENGTLHGNLYIVGEGDPTLGSKDSIATDLNAIFACWEKTIRNQGINVIEGCVVGDGRWLEGMPEEPTWLYEDIGTYYGSGVTGLMFYENMQSFSVSPGAAVGEPVKISVHYPSCSWMDYRYECTTGPAGTGDKLYLYTSDLAPVGVVRGTFGVNRGSKRVDFSNKFPEYTCAVYFKNYLEKNGIKCIGGAADFKLRTEWYKDSDKREGRGADGQWLKELGDTASPDLERIVYETNHASNNLYAETIFRTLGKELCYSSCYDSSYVAMNNIFKRMKLGGGVKVQDGSGLSRQNYVSADFMCRFLGAMMDSECFEEFLWSLPYPGGDGTLNYNLKGQPESLRKRIRVKSGSMNGVRCYSGYVIPDELAAQLDASKGRISEIPQEIKEQIIIFSILTNNCTSPQWKVRQMLDRFMADLAR